MDAVIDVQDVGMRFRLNRRRDDFRSIVLRALSGKRRPREYQWALQNVTFQAYPQEVLGVIGSNGAGKTTLCRVISNLLRPDTGTSTVQGEISALLSMGAGFNNELSGQENIYLNGMMMGMTRRQVAAYYQRIVDFSGLGEFITEPVKHYSKGMRARLGFSIAAMLEPEILVLDESLSTGDLEFSTRAEARMREIVAQAHTVVLVTHNMETILDTCNRAVWIDAGQVKASGPPQSVVDAYVQAVEEAKARRPQQKKLLRSMNLGDIPQRSGDRRVLQTTGLGVRFTINRKPFWALRDVNLSVQEGEIVGIIGHNGAGKTTLCRALTRIYRPDTGSVTMNGRVSALLSLGSGFNTQLTAMDNIMLNGLMMGISRRRMKKLRDQILEFAELEEHRDKPLKNYSSGMKSRLAFSIAATVRPSLLIVDEALSAGDLAFKEKAADAMKDMITRAEAVIVVTHSLGFVQKNCTRAVWLDHGMVKFDGEPEEGVRLYKAYRTVL